MFAINTNWANSQTKIAILNFKNSLFQEMVHEEEKCYQTELMRLLEIIPPEVAQVVNQKLNSFELAFEFLNLKLAHNLVIFIT